MSGFINYLKQNLLVVCLAVLSALLSIVANWSGVGWSWDTSDYVAVGKNFANGNGLLDTTGIPMTVRPPGLSILIGVGDWFGLSTNMTARLLNAICAAIVVLATHQLLRVAQTKISTRTIATAFVAFSPALFWQYSMIWSEPPFIALVAVAMIISLRPISTNKFVSLAVLFIALFFIRYVGPVFAIAIAMASAFFDRRQLGLFKSAMTNFLTLAVSLIPVWFWLQRNENIDGTLTGARTPGGGSLLDPLKTFAATLGSWLAASPVEGGIYLSWSDYPEKTKILGVLFMLIIVVLLAVYVVRQFTERSGLAQSSVLVLSASISVIYIVFSAYRFVHFELGPLDNRMMIPIYVPLVLVVAILIDNIRVSSSLLRTTSKVIFVLFVAFQAVSSIDDVIGFGRDGRYWSAQAFQDQPIHQFVKTLPTSSSLMSNQPQQLFAVWQWSSVFNQYQLELAQNADCDRRYFVWYKSTYDDGTLNVEGQPDGAETIYTDGSGAVLDLGSCNADITTFWPE